MISPPINLGQAGLDLEVRLYFQAQGSAPVVQNSASVTVNEIGLGDYYFGGLPEPPGGSTAALVIYETASPALAMYTYAYGAVPGTSIVWRYATQPAAAVQRIVQNDTYGHISLVVVDGLPAEVADGGTSAVFTLYDVAAGAPLFQDRPAVISNVAEDGGGNGYGCTLTYALQAGDTDAAGSFRGRFAIDYVGGMGVQTLPPDDSLRVEIVPDYDA